MSTYSYLPGYADDATADCLADIHIKTSKIVNASLKETDSKYVVKINKKTVDEKQIFGTSGWL